MTDHPYTDNDLRAEAARQHAGLTKDPDYVGVGEAMDTELVAHSVVTREDGERAGLPWNGLLPFEADDGAAYDEAQDAIHELISGAADVSEWAINLGADSLQPGTRVIDIGWTDGPLRARIHIAYAPEMPDDERDRLAADLSDAIAGTVPVR